VSLYALRSPLYACFRLWFFLAFTFALTAELAEARL
jgi:hypothetical protein